MAGLAQIGRAELDQIAVQLLAVLANRHGETPLARRRGTDFAAQTDQLPAELIKLPDLVGHRTKGLGLAGALGMLVGQGQKLVIELLHPADEGGALGGILRQEQAAGFGHHGINQAVHALDGLRALQGGFEFRGQFGMPPGAVNRDDSQHHGGGGEQGDDRVKLEQNGKVRQPWHFHPVTLPKIDSNSLTRRLR